jgi:hypothetical protein
MSNDATKAPVLLGVGTRPAPERTTLAGGGIGKLVAMKPMNEIALRNEQMVLT